MEKLKGKQQFTLEYGVHRFNYVAPFPILVSVDDVPATVIGGGKGKSVWKGEGTISLDPTDKDAYGFAITSKLTPKGESQDFEAPPEPAPADNYLAMMREKVRQQMGIIRENFAATPSIYEMGDIDTFVEDYKPPESPGEAHTAASEQSQGVDHSGRPDQPSEAATEPQAE